MAAFNMKGGWVVIEDVGRSVKLLTLVLLELLLDLAFSSRVRGARGSAKDERVVLK